MKRQLITTLAVVALLTTSVPVLVAQEEIDTSEETQVENVGILPTNPFYFLKEWGRGMRRAFIFDHVKRAEYELHVTDEKADELRKVNEVEGDNTNAIEKASHNYERAMERLKERLGKVGENSENPNVERLLNNVNDRILDHERKFERISDKFESVRRLRERIKETTENFDHFLTPPLEGVKTREDVREKLGDIVEERKEEFKERIEGVDLRHIPGRLMEFREKLEVELSDTSEFRRKLRIENKNGEVRTRVEERIKNRHVEDDVQQEEEHED